MFASFSSLVMNLDLDSAPLTLGSPLPNVDFKSRIITPIVNVNLWLGTMLKASLSMPAVWLWACWMAISMDSRSSGSLLVAAQNTAPGGADETLGISDPKITYQPELRRWSRRQYMDSTGREVEYLTINELGLGAGGPTLTSPRVNTTFRGSAIRYLSPIFPFNSSVQVSVDNGPQKRISLFDNSTARPEVGDDPETSPASGARTFTLAEQLDASNDHIVVVSSDGDDGSAFMHVGQFIVSPVSTTSPTPSATTTPSETVVAASSASGRNLKIILPVTLIGSFILIGLVVGLLFCHFRRKKASQSDGQRGWGWDATPLTAPAAAFVRRFSRRGPPPPPTPHVTPFSPGSEESALKDKDDFEDYVEAAAFQRRPSTMPNQDMRALHRPPSDRSHTYSSANDGGIYVPARLTQENLAMLSLNPSRVTTPPAANPTPPPIAISQRHRGNDHRSVVSANTAELLARDIPYLPYLHTLAQPSEHGHSRESQQQSPPVPLLPQRRTNHSSLESTSRPTVLTRNTSANASDPFRTAQGRSSSSTESHGGKARASPGLYPTYFPSADPTAAAIIERGEHDTMLPAHQVFKPNRRRPSGDSSGAGNTTEDSAEGYGPQYPSVSSHASSTQPPVPPPKTATPDQPFGGRRQTSLRRKAVPTIQELEASSTSSVDKQERRGTPPVAQTPHLSSSQPSSSQTHKQNVSNSSGRPLPGRPRPLPQTPPSHSPPIATTSSADGTVGHASINQHSASSHPRRTGSPPPSSYHATLGHDFRTPAAASSGSSSRRHDKKPSGSRGPRAGASGASGVSSGGNGKEREKYDPVWYPDRAAPAVEDDFDDMYVDAESPVASPRMFVQGSSGR